MIDYINKTKKGFYTKKINGVTLLTIPEFEKTGFIKHCFTTRIGGVSEGCFATLNLSKTREANAHNKKQNFINVCKALNVEYSSLVLVNYSHGDGIYTAKLEDRSKGFEQESDLPFCDAIAVNTPNVTGVTLHADCMPVFFADVKKRVVVACHAGYKGVYLDLPKKIVEYLIREFGSKPKDIIIGIGPHIMDCCFETQEDVYEKFALKYGSDILTLKVEKTNVNMQLCVLKQLKEAQIPPQNITLANMCTYCREDLFYSHRRDRGNTGAMGSFVAIYE